MIMKITFLDYKKLMILCLIVTLYIKPLWGEQKKLTIWPYGGALDSIRFTNKSLGKCPLSFSHKADFSGLRFNSKANFVY